jgi:hypothetical protein
MTLARHPGIGVNESVTPVDELVRDWVVDPQDSQL